MGIAVHWIGTGLDRLALACGWERARVDDARVVVHGPSAWIEARKGVPRVLFVQEPGEYDLAAEEAIAAVAVRADAYAGDVDTLAAAVAFVADGPRPSSVLALRYLGSLGERRPAGAPRVGEDVPLEATLTIGRSTESTIALRQGAHSDQNRVARRHARLEASAEGVRAIDLGTSCGTWLRGARLQSGIVRVGDELAIAATHRFELVGPPR